MRVYGCRIEGSGFEGLRLRCWGFGRRVAGLGCWDFRVEGVLKGFQWVFDGC